MCQFSHNLTWKEISTRKHSSSGFTFLVFSDFFSFQSPLLVTCIHIEIDKSVLGAQTPESSGLYFGQGSVSS